MTSEFDAGLRSTRYSGYASYSYLEAGTDVEHFDLAPELGRRPLYDLGLDAEQAERTRRLLDDNVVISLHDHPQVFPDDIGEVRDYIRTGRRPRRSHCDAVQSCARSAYWPNPPRPPRSSTAPAPAAARFGTAAGR